MLLKLGILQDYIDIYSLFLQKMMNFACVYTMVCTQLEVTN